MLTSDDAVGVAGFEPAASSSRTTGTAVALIASSWWNGGRGLSMAARVSARCCTSLLYASGRRSALWPGWLGQYAGLDGSECQERGTEWQLAPDDDGRAPTLEKSTNWVTPVRACNRSLGGRILPNTRPGTSALHPPAHAATHAATRIPSPGFLLKSRTNPAISCRRGYPILIGTSLVPLPEWTHAVPPFGAIAIAFALLTLSRGSGLLVTRLIGVTLSLASRESIT